MESCVAPLAGAWIEITQNMSAKVVQAVAPLAGAWIEIKKRPTLKLQICVAPLAGAWIEINKQAEEILESLSLPSRERGLKSA